jgi:hypothetical protein
MDIFYILGGAILFEDAYDTYVENCNFTMNGAYGLSKASTYSSAGNIIIYDII